MRFRRDALNVVIATLAVIAAVSVVALIPQAPPALRYDGAVAAGAAVVLAIIVGHRAMTRDSQRLAMFARLRGWRRVDDPRALARRFDIFPFGAGLGGTVVNALEGPHRFHDCATFTYAVGQPAPQFYQVTLVELGVKVPGFQLLPEDFLAGLSKLVGGQDIKVGDAAFDKRWRIIATDPEYVREVFSPELRARLDDRELHGMPLAISDGAILTWQAGAQGIRRISRKLDVLIGVAEAVPDWAIKGRRRP